MKNKFFFSILILIFFLMFSSNLVAQKKKKPERRLDVPTLTETLQYGDCAPIDGLAILTILENSELMLGSSKTERANLVKEFRNRICDKPPSDQIIYIKAGASTPYAQIVEILKSGRKTNVDDFGLEIIAEENSNVVSSATKVKVPAEESPSDKKVKAYPLALVVSLDENGSLKLNGKPETIESLTKKLKQTFLTRKQKRIYITGSKDIEKTVFVYAFEKVKFGDVVNLIRELEKTGADPIGLDVDDYFLKTIF